MSCKLTVSSPPRDAFDLGRLFIDIWVGYNNKTSDFIFLLCLLDRRKSVGIFFRLRLGKTNIFLNYGPGLIFFYLKDIIKK
jgi:hypothetical protein